ncbi:hypothetical protein [Streptomyces sp. NPDC087294]|uniref:hypothetical protein n=1 Tax=Streptomyces sp. NPDC087294 TaxID=3365777 RepID=UPI00382117CD
MNGSTKMMFSSTALASGSVAGPALVGMLVGVIGTVLGILTLRHHRQVLAWMKRTRATDDVGKDLDDTATYLRSLHEELCTRAQTPCRAADLAPLNRLRHLLDDTGADTEPIRAELTAVIHKFDRYLALVLPPEPTTARVAVAELTAQLATAMRQEQARIDLKGAVTTAQQKIRTLRRAA